MNIFEFQNESALYRQSILVNLRLSVPKLISDTVIKFHQVLISSKSVLSQMQHLQHNFKLKLTIDLTSNYEKIFEFQNGSTKKLNYTQSLSSNDGPQVLKSASKSMFVINFNFEWITLAVKQISGLQRNSFSL